MIDHSLVTGFTMFIRRSFDMTCFGISTSTYHRHEPPLLSRTPLALLFVCSTAPLSSQPAVVSGERGTEHDGDWPEAEGWLGRRGEMSGEVEIAFFFLVARFVLSLALALTLP